jgi:hypothetical protein
MFFERTSFKTLSKSHLCSQNLLKKRVQQMNAGLAKKLKVGKEKKLKVGQSLGEG